MSSSARSPFHANVEVRQGRATLLINGQPTAPVIYALTDCPGGRFTWEEVPQRNLRLFAENGCRLFQADLWLEWLLGPDDVLDVTLAQRQVRGILDACPDAAVMLRVHLNPPPAWCAAHPDECVQYADGPAEPEERWGLERWIGRDNDAPVRASFSSTHWQTWAKRQLTRFAQAFGATPEGGAVFALQVAYGVYGEWHQFGFFAHDPDVSPAATTAFQRWAQQRYGTESALAAAWNQPGITWAAIRAPDSPARERAALAVLRDPATQQDVIDYFLFQHEDLAEAVLMMARTVKAAWPRPVLTATFFGYFYCAFGREAAGGHLSLDRLLASPDLDCICATPAYTPTALPLGGSGHARGLVDAVRRAGKLWLDEMDRATSIAPCPWDKAFASTLADDVAVLRRNLLQPITRGGGLWGYDFGPISGTPAFARMGNIGWWDHPLLQREWRAIRTLAQARLAAPYERASDVLLLHDPWSFAHLASARHDPTRLVFGVMPISTVDPVSRLLTDGVVEALYQSGLIHTEALLSELPRLDLSPFRLVIVATGTVLDAAQRRDLRARVAQQGRHVVFLGYAGWSDGQRIGADRATALTDFPTRLVRQEDAVQTLAIDDSRETLALGRGFDLPAIDARTEQIVGRWADGTPSAAWRQESEATWWTFALPPNRPATWRAIGRRAGCLVVNDADETTLLGNGMLVVHTVAGGPRQLRLPGGGTVSALLPARSTTVFDSRTGEPLLAAG